MSYDHPKSVMDVKYKSLYYIACISIARINFPAGQTESLCCQIKINYMTIVTGSGTLPPCPS